jgi:hypothetical protein
MERDNVCLYYLLSALSLGSSSLHNIWDGIERRSRALFGEVKRRSHKMAAAFRNEESCLLLFYAVIRSLKFNRLTMPTASEAQPDSANLHTT